MTRASPGRAAVRTTQTWIALALALALDLAAARAQEPAASPSEPPTAADGGDAEALLELAERAMTEVDYDRTRELATAALERGELDRDGLLRAYRLIAVSSAQRGDDVTAERAFIRLFALEPESTISTRLAPARRTAVLNALGYWSVRRDAFGIDVSYARREREIAVRVRDPLAWGPPRARLVPRGRARLSQAGRAGAAGGRVRRLRRRAD